MASQSTAGLSLTTRQPWVSQLVELLSSMRFAISALAIVSIASAIGTVLQQNQPPINYINQFGQFWAEIFGALALYSIYNAPWFIGVLGFLLASTSLCVIRNTPKMVAEMRSWRDKIREQSFQVFPHRADAASTLAPQAAAERAVQWLHEAGYKTKQLPRDGAILIAAKRGAANRLGYIFAHAAIVIVCVGGMLDSDLPLRMQMLFGDKQPMRLSEPVDTVPASGRLAADNPSFRGSVLIPEGKSSDVAIVNWRDGSFLQDLPFDITLKRFVIDYYPTGMPKLFASEVTVRDKETGKQFDANIQVNHPLHYKGLVVYQSSFDDGGSKLKVKAFPMKGPLSKPLDLEGVVGESLPLTNGADKLRVEFTGFRAINVEDMGRADGAQEATDKKFKESVASVLSSATKSHSDKPLKNVGPSLQYKLRDGAGQAREFNNYMVPVELDGVWVFLAGVRDTPSEPLRYLRIPADSERSLAEFSRIRAAVANPELRQKAARRFADRAAPQAPNRAELHEQLRASAAKALDTYAERGFESLAAMLEKTVPSGDQERAAEVVMRMVQGVFWELWQVAREHDGLKPMAEDEANNRFAQLAMNAVSDSFLYDAPLLLQLSEFEEIKASVLQVSRAPGKNIVYLGCLLLVLGVFAMLYIRERRAWLWIAPAADGSTKVLFAASTTRPTLDFEREFAQLKQTLPQAVGASSQA